ncbi:hypothetical protein [Methylobacterium trifolii]|uniref:hypothetical protein n=1 Tax=Methylobacterium trifolii TaxID=1003092 RepID=UPI001EDE6DD3|nr:hypothetical protein [Methylobacterium trifolii]
MAQRPRSPAPVTVTVGPAWTGIALDGFKSVPSLRLSAEAPFSLRLDGERVQRVAPGATGLVRLRALRGLELRSARGRIPILLTPLGE